MAKAFTLTFSALRLWWREVLILTLFNLVWLMLQIPIVTGPPATAAMYRLARRVADEEYLELRHGWQALREMFWPAWKWGLVNLGLWIVTLSNFWAYRDVSGYVWMLLKLLWTIIALSWFTLNLFYWPFWLAQTDKRLRTTFRNSWLFVFKEPGLSLSLAGISLVLIIVSLLLTLPLAVALGAWLALLGVLAVDEGLSHLPQPQSEAVGASDSK